MLRLFKIYNLLNISIFTPPRQNPWFAEVFAIFS